MNSARMHVGIDVGKEWLDVCYPDGTKEHVRNIKSCRTKIIKKAQKLGAIISFEATGPYEEDLADECLAKDVKAVRLDAWGARKYAESQGRIEKNDSIDCEMIRDYAASLKEHKLHFIKPRSEVQRRLKAAVCVKKNLDKARAIIYNQLEHIRDAEIKKSIISTLAKVDKEIERLEVEADNAIADDERMSSLAKRFQEIKGVGPCLTRIVLAYCPDIGEFNSKSIAKMCGTAPIEHTSCTIIKRSSTKRGRSDLKRAFYMSAVSACKSNHILSEAYQRLVASGKPRKVALIAIARRIAVLLNNIAKYDDFRPAIDPKANTRKTSCGTAKHLRSQAA